MVRGIGGHLTETIVALFAEMSFPYQGNENAHVLRRDHGRKKAFDLDLPSTTGWKIV